MASSKDLGLQKCAVVECVARAPSSRPLCVSHWLMIPMSLRRNVREKIDQIGPRAIQPKDYSQLVASVVDAVRVEYARRARGADVGAPS